MHMREGAMGHSEERAPLALIPSCSRHCLWRGTGLEERSNSARHRWGVRSTGTRGLFGAGH